MVIVAVIMMLVLGAVLGLGLGVADKYLKVEADVRVEKVTSLLPGYNCGGCGFPGCSGMAEALVTGDMDHIACKPCKARDALTKRYRLLSTIWKEMEFSISFTLFDDF